MRLNWRPAPGLLLLLGVACGLAQGAHGAITNTAVDRIVDVSSYVIREATTVTFTGSAPVSEYTIVVPAGFQNKVSALEVLEQGGKQGKWTLSPGVPDAKRSALVYTVKFAAPVPADTPTTLVIKTAYVGVLESFPKEIELYGKHKVEYRGHMDWVSPYKSTSIKSRFKLPSATLHASTQHKTYSKSSDTVKYGPFKDVAPHTSTDVYLYFELAAANPVVHTFEKTVELSHWGGTATVNEWWDLRNAMANIKGHFSRIDFFRLSRYMPANVFLHEMSFSLPKEATDPYFKDEVGNVSTSRWRPESGRALLELKTRFPLFGGWRYKWFHGYTLPSTNVIRVGKAANTYVASIPFWQSIDEVDKHMSIEQATLRIAVPEGATNIKVYVPFHTDSLTTVPYATYLDSIGRTMVVITKARMSSEYDGQEIQVSYEYSSLEFLRKPLVLSSAVGLLFLASMIWNRSSWDLVPK